MTDKIVVDDNYFEETEEYLRLRKMLDEIEAATPCGPCWNGHVFVCTSSTTTVGQIPVGTRCLCGEIEYQ